MTPSRIRPNQLAHVGMEAFLRLKTKASQVINDKLKMACLFNRSAHFAGPLQCLCGVLCFGLRGGLGEVVFWGYLCSLRGNLEKKLLFERSFFSSCGLFVLLVEVFWLSYVILGGSLGDPWTSLGDSRGVLGDPWGILGGAWEVLGDSWKVPEQSLEKP